MLHIAKLRDWIANHATYALKRKSPFYKLNVQNVFLKSIEIKIYQSNVCYMYISILYVENIDELSASG